MESCKELADADPALKSLRWEIKDATEDARFIDGNPPIETNASFPDELTLGMDWVFENPKEYGASKHPDDEDEYPNEQDPE